MCDSHWLNTRENVKTLSGRPARHRRQEVEELVSEARHLALTSLFSDDDWHGFDDVEIVD